MSETQTDRFSRDVAKLIMMEILSMSIEGSDMIFHSLTFARSRGKSRVENRGRSPRFLTFPRDLANVNE